MHHGPIRSVANAITGAIEEELYRREEEIPPTSDLHGHEWHPEGRYFASGTAENHVATWDTEDLERPVFLRGHTSEVRTVSWHPDGERLASGSWDQTIKIWDAEALELALTLRGHSDEVTCVAWSPDGERLVSSSRDGTVRLWDASRAFAAE